MGAYGAPSLKMTVSLDKQESVAKGQFEFGISNLKKSCF